MKTMVKTLLGGGAALSIIYLLYLIIAGGFATKATLNVGNQYECATQGQNWKSNLETASYNATTDEQKKHYATEFAKVRLVCVNGPLQEVRDYKTSSEITLLSKNEAVVNTAKAQLIREKNKK
jgi:hypothetical protein